MHGSMRSATVQQTGEEFTSSFHTHCHPAAACAAESVRISRKTTALEHPYMSAFTIAEKVLEGKCNKYYIILLHYCNLLHVQPTIHVLCSGCPCLPYTGMYVSIVDVSHIPNLPSAVNLGRSANAFRHKCMVNDRHHIVMATHYQLEILAKASRWFINRTFKVR